MPVDTSQLDSDLKAVIADLPTTATINNLQYDGVFTDLQTLNTIEIGGVLVDYTSQFFTRVALFSSIPQSGTKVKIGNNMLRIVHVWTSPDGVGVRFDLTGEDE
jgi:hypothetical protein